MTNLNGDSAPKWLKEQEKACQRINVMRSIQLFNIRNLTFLQLWQFFLKNSSEMFTIPSQIEERQEVNLKLKKSKEHLWSQRHWKILRFLFQFSSLTRAISIDLSFVESYHISSSFSHLKENFFFFLLFVVVTLNMKLSSRDVKWREAIYHQNKRNHEATMEWI